MLFKKYLGLTVIFYSLLIKTFPASNIIEENPYPFFFLPYVAQGNSSIAYAEGFGALFSNPAGFAVPKGELNLLSWETIIFSTPEERLPLLRSLLLGSMSAEDEETLSQDLTTSALGVSSLFSLGYVGKGVGLGLMGGFDVVTGGEQYPLALEGDALSQFMLVIGYAVQKNIRGIQLFLGGDIRPLIRIHAPLGPQETALMLQEYLGTNIQPLEGDFFSDTYALNGYGVGIDVGCMVKADNFSFGIALRDLFDTRLFYSWNDLDSIRSTLTAGGLPSENSLPQDAVYTIPMTVYVGGAYDIKINSLRGLLEGRIHVEVEQPSRLWDAPTWNTYEDSIRGGMEWTLFSALSLRTGFYKGSPTYGLGLKVSILNINWAYFTRTVELSQETRKVPGLGMEVAIRW
jgi:hypothetical protein